MYTSHGSSTVYSSYGSPPGIITYKVEESDKVTGFKSCFAKSEVHHVGGYHDYPIQLRLNILVFTRKLLLGSSTDIPIKMSH